MKSSKSPRILVADDDLGVIAAYRHVLEGNDLERESAHANALEAELFGDNNGGAADHCDWRVHFVDQGQDAIDAVKAAIADADPFTLVFLDIRMPPGLDGYETAERIRQIAPKVHIVFVSAYSDYTDKDLSRVAAPSFRTSILPKPVWPDQLKAVATAHCKDSQLLELLSVLHRRRASNQAM